MSASFRLKAFADDKLNVTQDIEFFCHNIENIMEKEENAGDQHFLLFIRSSKTGRIMGSPVAGGWAASSSLSGAYLQNYST